MVSFTAQQIALLIQGKIEGEATAVVEQFGKIESAMPGEISFLANPKYEDFLYTTKASVIIVNESLVLKKKITATLIRVPDAYAACEKIKAAGGKVTREAGPVKGGTTVIAFVTDPDGYKVELIQRAEFAGGQGLR